MEKEPRNPITLIGIGIGIGGMAVLLLLLLGARITGLHIGGVELGFPTQSLIQTPAPESITQPTSYVTQQPTKGHPLPTTMVQVFPTSTPSLEIVYREATGGYVTKKYDITLSTGEIIVGQGYGFQQQTGGCVAYIIKGPGHFTFSVTDGAWLYYKNVTSSEQIELLLQNQIDSLGQYGCTPTMVKIIRLP